MIPQWRIAFWRWFTNKRQDVPRVVLMLLGASIYAFYYKLASGSLESLPGFTHDYKTQLWERRNGVLDEEKMKLLAERRQKMIKDQDEAKLYFQTNGYQPRATNGNIILNDHIGF